MVCVLSLCLAIAGVLSIAHRQHWGKERVCVIRGRQTQAISIDINTAHWWQLAWLPRIAEVKARRIVEYRNEHGPFRDIYELTRVNGIGHGIVDQIKEYIVARHPDTGIAMTPTVETSSSR